MSHLRFFLTSVSHCNGEGYAYAAACIDLNHLANITAKARSALSALVEEDNLWGDITLRGFLNGVLFGGCSSISEDLEADLAESIDCLDLDNEHPIEITEAQYDSLSNMKDAGSFDCAGMMITKDSIKLVAYPRHGEGEASSCADFNFLLNGAATAVTAK